MRASSLTSAFDPNRSLEKCCPTVLEFGIKSAMFASPLLDYRRRRLLTCPPKRARMSPRTFWKAAAHQLHQFHHHQLHQLPLGENPTDDDEEDVEIDEPERCWTDDSTGEKVWMTSFPPPAGFDGWEKCEWGQWGYERECTPEEAAALETAAAAARAEHRAKREAERDAWFGLLREELGELPPGSLTP